MKKYDVVGVGLNIIDLLFISPENVVADGKQFVEDFVMQGGAPIGSAVSAIARMGYKAAFAARMDNSALSSIARSELRSNNISDDLVITDSKSKPAIAIVSIDKKTSGRTVYIGMKDYGFLRKKDIPVEAIRNSKLLMADTKFEFGTDAEGKVYLIDEVLTPDSSRYWPADKYEVGKSQPSYDKQYVRDWLETLDWNKQAPGPVLPPEVVANTIACYSEALSKLMK